jgi:hypothetical protein
MTGEQARSKPALLCVPTTSSRPHREGLPPGPWRCSVFIQAPREGGLRADLGLGRIEPDAMGAGGRKIKLQGLVKLIRV